MSLHKLSAGDGYTYLTRQVAAHDATERPGAGRLGSYYTARGESPGVWIGRGCAAVPGFAGGPVTEAQMTALFGAGRHPDADRIAGELSAAGASAADIQAATRLGAPYRVYTAVPELRRRVAERFAAENLAERRPPTAALPAPVRARLRTEVATEMCTGQLGRAPADARELSGFLARACRPATTAVAGYDLTFSPVKSVSALWALAPRDLAERIERAHAAAVADTLAWLEDAAAYTRTGRNGVAQVEVVGLIGAAFTHRDSRAGDPDLHTHVAISNKVCSLDGRWLALDGRPLHAAVVAASERYNTRLEAHLRADLGLRFAERAGSDPGKRPVREVEGLPPALLAAWSARRAAIDARRAELAVRFQAEHGRTPTAVEALALAQQATLETRAAKHEPRSLAQQRSTWRAQARAVLGGKRAVAGMLRDTLAPGRRPAAAWGAAEVAAAAEAVLTTVGSGRASWREVHVRAEAERAVRAAGLALAQVDSAVEQVVAAALSPALSVPLGAPDSLDPSEPAARRRDGSSVYSPAGSQLYTSAAVLAAEEAILAAAGRKDGRVVPAVTVDRVLAASAASGVGLNPGQAALVRELAGSGARLQLALAPAGTGKTTAMAVLARAWTESGGEVLGLAPSAAASAVLREQLGAPTDTLAKLLHDARVRPRPDWLASLGPASLVVVDEAGMAGTAELARAVQLVLGAGGSLRLVGDDAQLAALGAGGVLRDVARTAGAVTLSQVLRFADPAEAAASLALRAGEPAALGYYLDAGRVHVGADGTVAGQAYAGWAADRAAGRDAVLLAPTRELVAELNARARSDRLAGAGSPSPEAVLADGCRASAGEVVLTRRNDRRLPLGATDWVKNGDRWTVKAVRPDGALEVAHLASRRRVRLPADYVGAHVALGYASTVHGAQGITAQVCHTVATGAESRQLLYVAMTRGRAANHVYLSIGGDGDPDALVRADAVAPPTAAEVLTRVLARDEAATSAATAGRELADPARRLASAVDRYADAVATAAELDLGEAWVTVMDAIAEAACPGLVAAPAYPALLAQLARLAVERHDPAALLRAGLARRDLAGALDPAAVLSWRLEPPAAGSGAAGPLPWLPAIPGRLAADPAWASYLARRERQVRELATAVAEATRGWTPSSAPAWASPLLDADPELLGDLAVWRATFAVQDTEPAPTGPPQLRAADARAQRALDRRVERVLGDPAAPARTWAGTADAIDPRLRTDPYWPRLADRLAAAARAGIDIAALAVRVGAERPLPDEMPAAALEWRLARHLSPAALEATAMSGAETLRPSWTAALSSVLGSEAADRVRADRGWPALVAAVTEATVAGWEPEPVLATAHELLCAGTEDAALLRAGELAPALTWRVRLLSDPANGVEIARTLPEPREPAPAGHEPVGDPADGRPSPADEAWLAAVTSSEAGSVRADPVRAADPMPGRQRTGSSGPVPPERILELNRAALAFFAAGYPGSWAAGYLAERLGTDLAAYGRFTAGYAPSGWTALVEHLRAGGARDDELVAAGLAVRARTGRVLDRFRDRLVLPIHAGGDVVGFVGRRSPAATEEAGPKYLNTPATAVFAKGECLFGLAEGADALAASAIPVLVEGPLDAIAVTLAGSGDFVGLAPLGTALTDAQAELLRPYLGRGTVVATDADPAGRAAAIRDYWRLVLRGDVPRQLQLADGLDPAELLQAEGPASLRAALMSDTRPLVHTVIDERIARYAHRLENAEGVVLGTRAAAAAIAPLPPASWAEHVQYVSSRLHPLPGTTEREILVAAEEWDEDPAGVVRRRLGERLADTSSVGNEGPATACVASTPPVPVPTQRWSELANRVDPRLTADPHWPALVGALDRAEAAGYDVAANLPRLATERPLPEAHPGRTLHHRLVGETVAAVTPLPLSIRLGDGEAATRRAAERAHAERSSPQYSRPAVPPASREAAAPPKR